MIQLNRFEKKEKIGAGGFGEVFIIEEKTTGKKFVAKISLFSLNTNNLDDILNISREININARVDHPSFIKFIGFNLKNFSNENKPVIITEFSEKGSLLDIIEQERKSLAPIEWNLTKKIIIIFGIASGMSFLHSNDVIHRDIKPSNILIDANYLPKIADLGLSKRLYETQESTSTVKGTKAYLAPEIIKNKKYTKKSDVYAFGILMYEILTLQIPFKEVEDYLILPEVVNGRRPLFQCELPDCYHDLIEKCWNQDPNERPTFDQIVDMFINDDEFTSDIDYEKDDFLDYVDMINSYSSFYDKEKCLINIYDYIDEIEFKLRKIDKFDLTGFNLVQKIGNFQSCEFFVAQKGTEKIIIEQFSNLKNEKLFIKKMKMMKKSSGFLCSYKGISFIDIYTNHSKYPLIIHKCEEYDSLDVFIENIKLNLEFLTESTKMIFLYGIAKAMIEHQGKLFHFNSPILNHIFICSNQNEISNFDSYWNLLYLFLTGQNYSFESDLNILTDEKPMTTYLKILTSLMLQKNGIENINFFNVVELYNRGIILPSVIDDEIELGIYKDYLLLYDQSFEFNETFALREIGKYYYGRNILDICEGEKALKCFQAAAIKGDQEAIFYLAQSYENGIGCEIDQRKAEELFTQSAISGFENSIKYLSYKEKISNDDLLINVKVAIIGSDFTGKSILAQKLSNIYNTYKPQNTISFKSYPIYYVNGQNEFVYEIIDTPSQITLVDSFNLSLIDASLYVIVFSINNIKSFNDIISIINQLNDTPYIIIGTNADLKRQINLDDLKYLNLNNSNYVEVSCLNDQNIDLALELISRKIWQLINYFGVSISFTPTPSPQKTKCNIY